MAPTQYFGFKRNLNIIHFNPDKRTYLLHSLSIYIDPEYIRVGDGPYNLSCCNKHTSEELYTNKFLEIESYKTYIYI